MPPGACPEEVGIMHRTHRHRTIPAFLSALLAACISCSPATGAPATDEPRQGELIRRATRLAANDPSVHRRIGLAEMLRTGSLEKRIFKAPRQYAEILVELTRSGAEQAPD